MKARAQMLAPVIAQVDLNLKQGAGATILLTVADRLGNPIVDTSSCLIQAKMRDSLSSLVVFEWNTTPGVGIGTVSLDYSSLTQKSIASLLLTGAQTASFDFWLAGWDCFITVPSHEPYCLAEGTVTLDKRLTY
jgi:hypothetical protein